MLKNKEFARELLIKRKEEGEEGEEERREEGEGEEEKEEKEEERRRENDKKYEERLALAEEGLPVSPPPLERSRSLTPDMKRNGGRTVQPQPEDLSSRSLRDRGRSLRDRGRSIKEDRRSPPEVRRSVREGERYMRFRNHGEKEEDEEDEDGGQDEEDRVQEEDERVRDDEERGREENLIHILGRLRGRSPDMQGACDWCFRVSTPQFSLPVSDGEELKLFCSESCFSHYRRAVFKVGRAGAGNVCDNCKQVRQDTLVVQDNTRKMYFCSTTCLNLYREGFSSSSENIERTTERPTVKVKPDHLLKKPELKNREIENRRYKCIGGGGVNGIRKTAVRDRQQRRVPADQRLGVVPHIQLAGSNRPQVASQLELLGLQHLLNNSSSNGQINGQQPGIIQFLLPKPSLPPPRPSSTTMGPPPPPPPPLRRSPEQINPFPFSFNLPYPLLLPIPIPIPIPIPVPMSFFFNTETRIKEEPHVELNCTGSGRKRKNSDSPEKETKPETRGTEFENKMAKVTRIKSENVESNGDIFQFPDRSEKPRYTSPSADQLRYTESSPDQSKDSKQQLTYALKQQSPIVAKKTVLQKSASSVFAVKSQPQITALEKRTADKSQLVSAVSDKAAVTASESQLSPPDKLTTTATSPQLMTAEDLERRKRRALIMDR